MPASRCAVRDGRKADGYALIDSRRYTIAPPGRLPLDPIRFSLVDVPDLQVLPELWPGLRSVWMGAGPVPEILHRALNALAWLVRLKLLPSLSPFAPLMHRTMQRAELRRASRRHVRRGRRRGPAASGSSAPGT